MSLASMSLASPPFPTPLYPTIPPAPVSSAPSACRRRAATLACAALVAALGGCSTSSRLSMHNQPPPKPRPVVRDTLPPVGDQRSALGRPAAPAGHDYQWNGSPNRLSEGAPPPPATPTPRTATPAMPQASRHAALPPAGPPAASPATTAPAPEPAAAAALPRGSIAVQPGDTLYGLSRRHGVSISALMETNKLKSLSLQPGQILKLPAASRPRG